MRNSKVVWKADKNFDKLVAQYEKEKTIKFTFKFENTLARLLAEKKLDRILDK
jgi:hypothetical protein